MGGRQQLLVIAVVLLTGCKPDTDGTRAPPGDLAAYTPLAHAGSVAAFAGPKALLLKIDATRVPSSGAIPLSTDDRATIAHDFVITDSDGDHYSVPVRIMKPRAMQTTTSGDFNSGATSDFKHLGMGRVPSPNPLDGHNWGVSQKHAVPLPKCTAAALWKTAIAAGAPGNLLASIEYDRTGYRLFIRRQKRPWYRFDADCKLKPEP